MNRMNLKAYAGQHCETTATGTLLRQIGIDLSEPMLFGLGEGLSFIFWNMKTMDCPFLGGRIKPDLLTQNIVKNLNLKLTVKETMSTQKAWDSVKDLIDHGQAVGLKLDSFYLEYFTQPIHFAAHYVAIYGYDKEQAYLVDTQQQGGEVRTSLRSLALARREKGPMASKNLYYTIDMAGTKYDLETAIMNALRNNANEYLNPAIKNVSYKGILKASSEIITWFENSKNAEADFKTTATLMEKAGTGGALFRNLYRDFIKESYKLRKIVELKLAHESFIEIAGLWTTVSSLFEKAGSTKDIIYIYQASEVLKDLSIKEK
jgi:hypothetical protein